MVSTKAHAVMLSAAQRLLGSRDTFSAMAWRTRGAIVALLSSGVAIMASSCREATAIVIDARTNAPQLRGTSFTVGAPGETENGPPTTFTTALEPNGTIGTLVVVPGSSDDAQLSVKVVAGVDRPPSQCKAPDYFGCIVARRLLRYRPHLRLELPVLLDLDCASVPCDAVSTCRRGSCVDAEVPCDDERCSGAPDDPGPPVDAGGRDAVADSSFNDSSDAASNADAALDGGKDGSVGGTPGKLDCVKTTCDLATKTRCCFNANNQTGVCAPATSECTVEPDLGFYQFDCDGNEDCDPGTRCCATTKGFACMGVCPAAPVACHSTGACATGACTGRLGNYYKFCQP